MTRRTIGVEEKPPLAQTIPLSLQHLFAMFGATVLVPILFITEYHLLRRWSSTDWLCQ
ncbi:uracil permease [Xenorhabdus thuongxuanensis]|uniref:Uracil permease n=1 Tax=Xenorhabdus thuongxuanensis TaxID=1873484 RepID=A0A1Q5U5A5_9GAMM|nr:uracil permease [Xenorhabdus thuongxuanensis]